MSSFQINYLITTLLPPTSIYLFLYSTLQYLLVPLKISLITSNIHLGSLQILFIYHFLIILIIQLNKLYFYSLLKS